MLTFMCVGDNTSRFVVERDQCQRVDGQKNAGLQIRLQSLQNNPHNNHPVFDKRGRKDCSAAVHSTGNSRPDTLGLTGDV